MVPKDLYDKFRLMPWWVRVASYGAVAVLIFLLVSTVSSTVAGWRDSILDWNFDRKDAKLEKQAEDLQPEIDRLKAANAQKDLTIRELKTKYDLAIRATQLEHGKGAELDNAINSQIETLHNAQENPVDAPVDDAQFVEQLRAHDAATGRLSPTRDKPKVRPAPR